MHFFKSNNKHIIGLSGGKFESFEEEPYAIILDEKPIPTRKWQSPYLTYQSEFNETLETQCTFLEYTSGEKQIYILQIEEKKLKPRYISRIMEFHINEDYVNSKVEKLRQSNQLAVFEWDIEIPTWIEVERNFEYEDDGEPVIMTTFNI